MASRKNYAFREAIARADLVTADGVGVVIAAKLIHGAMIERVTGVAIMEELAPEGCGVVIEATHSCMTIRGIQKPGAKMITSAMRGGLKRRPETRAEFFAILRNGQ